MEKKKGSPRKKESPSERSERLFREVLRRCDAGEKVDPEEYLRKYPDLVKQLEQFFAELKEQAKERPSKPPDAPSPQGKAKTASHRGGGMLGDFKVIRKIGSGGMGTVYEAVQISLKRRVALKVLPPHLSFCDEAVMKFRREAMAGGRQSHPCIVAIFAVGQHRGTHYIAQELVQNGCTLADRLEDLRKEEDFPNDYYREAAELIAEVADALQHAHDTGVIHRDVKPSNILLTPEGRPKVTDFGLAKVEDALALSRSGEFAGTPYYMSPEQAASQRIGIDHRTDIFSLGVTFYEMLTLERPFEGETKEEVLKKILLKEPKDPRKLFSHVPRDLATICLKAMEKDPTNRYPTMTDFAEEIERYLAHGRIFTKPAGLVTKAWRRIKRNRIRVAVWTLVIALLAALYVVVGTSAGDPPEEMDETAGQSADVDLGRGEPIERLRRIELIAQSMNTLSVDVLSRCLEELPILKGELSDELSLISCNQLSKSFRKRLDELEAKVALDVLESRKDVLQGNEETLREAQGEMALWSANVPAVEQARCSALNTWIEAELGFLAIESYLTSPIEEIDDLDQVKSALEAYVASFEGVRDTGVASDKLQEINELRESRAYQYMITGFRLDRAETFTCGDKTNTVEIYVHQRTGLEFVLVPGGSFMMGSPEDDEDREEDEGPPFKATVKPFLICRTECTQAAWDLVGGEDSRRWRGELLPMENVTWNECSTWCRKAGLRLPSEVEWEYACRAGTTTRYFYGDERSRTDEYSFGETSEKLTRPVGQKKTNAFGLHDMQCNVWEWCEDRYHASYSGAPTDGGPWDQVSGSEGRVGRGGGWYFGALCSRAARRGSFEAETRDDLLGFRPAFSLP